ncbi:hypothetical protein [Arthrobacter sp. lap29]|uniref:hypothetical protein n=1 Tax=Arthrobacter sp. lap29 TaxID=3056122 RepID=UPI0028F72923|nr:hypothetical protein [Arthrobacter sp. lap29]
MTAPERHALEAAYSAAKDAAEQAQAEVTTARQMGAQRAVVNVLRDAYWEANDAANEALDYWAAAVDEWATN